MRVFFFGGMVLAALSQGALAADPSPMPVKAPPASAAYDWSGYYAGTHFGFAGGSSRWSATQGGGLTPSFSGSLDMFNFYDGFHGTGSYLLGFQAGYNYMLPSRLVIGAEADVSFPNLLSGSQTISSPLVGQASFQDQVEFSGTVRGRIGYAPGNWLFYATGGFAYSYDQFTRTQLSGVPVGGTALPGQAETIYMVPRVGGAVGGGVELALAPNWMARIEYLFTDYASHTVNFPAGGQRFTSDLAVQTLRAGLDYRIGRDAVDPQILLKDLSPFDLGSIVVHGETAFIEQYAAPFRAPYRGQNSLDPNSGRETWPTSLYVGARLWQGAELWFEPELGQGFGLSNTVGIAGFTSGAAYRVGSSVPYPRIQRTFLRQTIDLGGAAQKVDADLSHFAGSQTADRLIITIGKFSVTDIFDINKYATNPRVDFMNWALVNAGTFDYAADAWGYTYGAAAEWYRGDWTVRSGLFDLSLVPNGEELDPTFEQFQWVGEIERRYQLWGHPGKIAVTGYLTRGRMGTFADAIALAQATGMPAGIAAVRQYRSRGGVDMNVEQEVTSDLGVFMRAGWANGDVEPYEYTDIDRTVAAGFQLKGTKWGRPDDTFGLAGIVNGISAAHQAFLNAGGLGILVGDGMLPHPGPEGIIETYYQFPVYAWSVAFDYQFVVNPAYNRDRGPVSVLAARLRKQF
jgi:high affinity Mn2+ porin